MVDIGALILHRMLELYNLGTHLLTKLLLSYAQSNPRVAQAIQALGSAFNMLIGVTVLYIVMKLFSKFEKVILALIIIGWIGFALILAGLLNPHTAAQVAQLVEKAANVANATLSK